MADDTTNHKGILILKGCQVGISNFSISIDEKTGQLASSDIQIQTGLDMSIMWLRIMLDQLKRSDQSYQRLLEAHRADQDTKLGVEATKDFDASMQTIIAAGAAIDSFYVSLRDRTNIPQGTLDQWAGKKNKAGKRTARWKQQTEVFRRAFKVNGEQAKNLKTMISEITKYRDWATHPDSKMAQPVLYVEIQRGIDKRLFQFRNHNARDIAFRTLRIISQCCQSKRPQNSEIEGYQKSLRPEIKRMVNVWHRRYKDDGKTPSIK